MTRSRGEDTSAWLEEAEEEEVLWGLAVMLVKLLVLFQKLFWTVA